MLKAPPLTGAYTVLQNFGDNPARYKKWKLPGHDGVDLQAPAGRVVTAVQRGVVSNLRINDARFGQALVLKHEWGDSFYGHVTGVTVAIGDKVQAGQTIAAIGVSPDSPSHLHFGLRVRPYIYADGWNGFSDPAPYLTRLTKPRGPLIGPHIIGGVHRHLDLLKKWQPRVITVLDPNPDEMAELRLACPSAIIIGRIFVPDSDVESRIRANPESAAEWAHNLTMARMTPHVNFWQIANEVLQTVQTLPLLARFEIRRMQLASTAMYFCAIFAFSVGNPDMPPTDRMSAWRLLYPAMELAEKGGHAVAVHQYGKPDIWTPDQDWYGYRLEHQVLKYLPFKKLQFIVSEYGIDGTINGGARQGWQQYSTADAYVKSLVYSAQYLERFSGRVLGNTVFALGQTSPWQTYDIAGAVAQGLAEKLPRGTWATVKTEGTGIAPGRQPKPPAGKETVTPTPPTIERRLTDSFDDMRMSIKTIAERPDHPTGNVVYLVKDVFTTHNGSWDVNGQLYSAPQWAKDAYLSGAFTKAYERNNLYGAVIGLDGKYVFGQEILHWTGGIDKLIDLGSTTYAVQRATENPGWSTMVMYSSSNYSPGAGMSGPWCWTPNGLPSEVVCGGGLPNGEAVSTFVVWQAVAQDPGTPTPDPTDPPTPTPDPTDPTDPTPTPAPITRRLGAWVDDLRIQIKSLSDRPDPAIPGDIVYLIKDIFTTRDGSWEQKGAIYGIDQWARDTYLKPTGDPEYFDDAGADHHIFGAMLDENGKLIKNFDFLYWSDGFAKLGDPNYNGYVMGSNGNRYPKTKDKSGWVNIPLEPGSSYVPERGESGPWCWVPRGVPAEVVCGGGMPAKNHVSFFVVWQAVRRSSLTPTPTATATDTATPTPSVTPTPTEPPVLQPLPDGSFHLFMPSLQNTQASPAAQAMESDVEDEAISTDMAISPVEEMRAAAWSQIGIEYAPASSLARYARQLGLGAPITDLFAAAGFIVQGFHGGIVYAADSDKDRPAHIPW